MLFQAPSTVNKITTLADSTIRLVVDCQETTPEEMAKLFSLKGKLGWFLFKQDEIVFEDLPTDKMPEIGGKTPSQRLRDRMFAMYASKHEDKTKFNTWYAEQLDKIGQQYLDRIEE